MKIDFKKTLASYKAKRNIFSIINVPKLQYLMIDGLGDPNKSKDYKDAIEILYAIAFTLKFNSKTDLKKDYVVPPLEGLWWADNMNVFMDSDDKSMWHWTAMIMVPNWINKGMLNSAKEKVAAKVSPLGLNKLRLETLAEDACVQILYVGPFSKEGPTIEKMHQDFIPNNKLVPIGKHHEIYFSDPRKTLPDKLKTIIRQPVKYI